VPARLGGGARFETFCAEYLRQSKGRFANQPLILEPWQSKDMASFLAEDRRGKRKNREGALFVAKKNGKSTMIAGLALYLLMADDEPGADVISAAASKDQARIVFNEARSMVERSPLLRNYCNVYRNEITCPDGWGGTSVYRVTASDAPKLHGPNPSAILVDELHAHEDDGELYYTLRAGGIMREQFVCFSISTAGYDMNTVAGEIFERGLRGDPTLWFRNYAVESKQAERRTHWKKANPSSWITQEMLEREHASLPRFVFQRLHLNIWTSAEEIFIQPRQWDDCQGDADIDEGEDIFLGVDLGLKHDTAAVAWVSRDYAVGSHVWGLWPDRAKGQPPAHKIIESDRLPISEVEDYILDLSKRYNVVEVRYDPYRFERSAQELSNLGFWMNEMPQTDQRMVPATTGLYDSIVQKRYYQSGDHVLRTHLLNAAAKETPRGYRLDKKSARRPMDAAVALAMATAGLLEAEGAGMPHVESLSA
jgi:phage terminase large subunit-like protein